MVRRRFLLIVDDDQTASQQLATLLTRFRDWCDIEICQEGMKAAEILGQRPADLMFLDPRLPDCNGMDLIHSTLQDHPETDIVVVIPPGLEAEARRALEAGAVGVLIKPCQASELEEIVSRCVGIQVGLRGDVDGISLGDLVQMIHAKKWDRTVMVTSTDGKIARIFFRRGEIRHVETDILIGIDAFNQILNWPQGRFEIHTGCATDTVSVEIPTMQVLIDGLRRSDEDMKPLEGDFIPAEDEIGAMFDSMMMPPSAADVLHPGDGIQGASHPSAVAVHDGGMPSAAAQELTASEKLDHALNRLRAQWDLAESCAIVDEMGFVLAGRMSGDVPDNFWGRLFGVTAAFFDDSAKTHRRGLFREGILLGTQGGLAVLTIPRTSCFLVATTKEGARTGLVLAGLESALDELSTVLQDLV